MPHDVPTSRSRPIQALPARLAAFGSTSRSGAVARLLLVFGLVWLGTLLAVSRTAPVDNLEQLTWVRSLEWGYYKHPPLPTWLLWPLVQLFGPQAWVAAVMGAATTLCAVALTWRLVAELRGERHAWIALLAVLSVTFYSGSLVIYNHNVVLMACASAAALAAWRAIHRGGRRWWLLLGLCLGLATLSKYQSVLTMAGLLLFCWRQGLWRQPEIRRGVLLAASVTFVMIAPHVLWLEAHQFAPFAYARETSLGAELSIAARWMAVGHWLIDQLGNRALLALLLLAVVWRSIARRQRDPARSTQDPARDYLLCLGLTPFVLMPLLSLTAGSQLHYHWGSPYLLMLVPALMELPPGVDWRRADRRHALQVFMLLQALLLGYTQFERPPVGPRHVFDWRNLPSRELAERMAWKARRQMGGPIEVIAGPAKIAGALAAALPEHPLVLIDGRLDRSPWLDEHQLAAARRIEVGMAEDLPEGRPFGPGAPDWRWQARPPVVVDWPQP